MEDTFRRKDKDTVEITSVRDESKEELLTQKELTIRRISILNKALIEINNKLDLLNEGN